jgi:hypothetical protein
MRIGDVAACIVTAAMGFTVSAAAANPPDTVLDFPAGTACDFDLRIELRGGDQQHYKEFLDKNGNVVRSILAGKGSALTFINASPVGEPGSGATLSLKANGFSDHQTYNPNGTVTDTTMGHVVLLLATTDVPAGPSTTLYVGRLVLTIDIATNVFTFQSFSGNATDICAAID